MVDLTAKLSQALQLCGVDSPQFTHQLIGQGAWHEAYLIKQAQQPPLVVRLRKQVIYGEVALFDREELHSDYAPVGLYYEWANRCQPAVCPTIYHYHVSPELSCTVESYMSQQFDYTKLSEAEARQMGQALGRFFRQMHQQPAPISGHGEIGWREGGLVPEADLSPAAVWQTHPAPRQIEQLAAARLPFEAQIVQNKIEFIWQHSRYPHEPFTLVNRDITPENLIASSGRFTALIDPVPMLDNAAKFAAWFLFCYKFLLPAYNPIPRYAHHQFQQYAPILNHVAAGYLEAYTQNDPTLKRQIRYAYYHVIQQIQI